MAAAIPFVASALGASTAVSIGISVAFSVTGISDKINKAASKVFGKDLVNVGNLFAAGYAAYNGGFDIGGGGAAAATADATAMNVPNGAEAGSLFEAQMAKMGATPASVAAADGSSVFENIGVTDAADAAFEADPAAASSGDGGFMPSEQATTNLLDGTATTGVGNDGKLAADAAKPTTSQVEQPTGAAAPKASASNAAGTRAAGSNAAANIVPNATQQGQAFQQYMATQGIQPKATDGNIFTRLFTNKDGTINTRMVGGVMQGVGLTASAIGQASEANKARKWQQDMYNARPTGVVRQ